MIGKTTDEKAYKLLQETFDSNGWSYKTVEENMGILSSFKGDDLNIGFHAFVRQGAIRMSAILSFKVPEKDMKDFVWNLNKINSDLLFGNFTLNPDEGFVTFDYAYIFSEAKPSTELLESIIGMVINTTDRFDGKLHNLLSEDETDHPSGPMYS